MINLRRFNTKSEIFLELIRELLYADDAVFLAYSQTDMQHIMNHFSQTCNVFGLNIGLKKAKVMFTPAPDEPYIEHNITVNNARLDIADTFIYFGSTLSRDGLLDAEIYSCISKASVAFGKLEKKDWADSDIPINKKIGVCRTCVILILVYLAETWTTHRILEHFHQKCVRHILNKKWQTYIPDTTML